MHLGHWHGPIPEQELPKYEDADFREVLKRLSNIWRDSLALSLNPPYSSLSELG